MKMHLLLILLSCGFATAGEWQLKEGTVHFTSIKNGNAPVSGTLPATGGLKAGAIEVSVDLEHVVTGDLARDINLKTWLFEIANHPKMVIKANLASADIPQEVGAQKVVTIDSTVHYRGLSAEMKVPVILIRTDEQHMAMVSNRNVVMTLESLGLMGKPLEMLIKICAHESVSPLVFLSFEGQWQTP